jgi:Cu(I)/Ag(I) efflux system membrane fusion protein
VGVLCVPITAVLDSGTRQIVYVDRGGGTFEPRVVTLGPRSGDYYPILAGVVEGEHVATRGGFLIDSQFQITGRPSLLYPGGLHAAMGHQHGAAADGAAPASQPSEPRAAPGDHKH